MTEMLQNLYAKNGAQQQIMTNEQNVAKVTGPVQYIMT